MASPSLETCTYCRNRPADGRDHVIPHSHGGPYEWWNLVPVCAQCNGMLSYYLPARDGDTVGAIRGKKARFLRRCCEALRSNWRWCRLRKQEKWECIRRGDWVWFLPEKLRRKYEMGRTGPQTRGRVICRGRVAKWRLSIGTRR